MTSLAAITFCKQFDEPAIRCHSSRGFEQMPTTVTNVSEIRPGEIYEDTAYHPCLCIAVQNGEVTGISLVDGSYPRTADIGVSNVRKLTLEEAWRWRKFGPNDVVVPADHRWWPKK
jgi:hypothetical protein